MAISVRDLRNCYGDTPADVAPGEVFGLLGANGAGVVIAARYFRWEPAA